MSLVEQYGPWALIAGGSEGVGAAFARQLGQQGFNLMLVARKPEPLEEVAQTVRAASGVQVQTICVDLSQQDAVQRVRRITDGLEFGLLIYNAGAQSHVAEFVDEPVEDLRRLVSLNAIGQMLFAHHFAGPMRTRGRGGIILVSSLASYVGVPRMSVYAASKAFCRILAEGLWLELGAHGVHVLGLVLGNTRTPGAGRSKIKLAEPVAEPSDVAREGLAHLANGPVWIAGGNAESAAHLAQLSRAEAVRLVHRSMLEQAPPD